MKKHGIVFFHSTRVVASKNRDIEIPFILVFS
jgi:hypothetical protein